MEIDVEAEVSVKDIVNFYIKINDSSKAKKDIAQMSAKDKAGAFEIIAGSAATRDFRIDVARYFIYDLDARVRKKAERFMEDLVPGWVTDPAESILKLLKLADGKGESSRNSAVKFLFGIVDSGGLRAAFMTLLNGRNRAHLAEIIAILEDYIEASADEREQVKIFDACLEIIVSDEIDQNIKYHASNLLSVFFNKVSATNLGETLKRKYVEKQMEKAEGIYRYLCSGSVGLNSSFLDDLLRPLHDGGSAYQLKILNYFKMVLEKAKKPEEADSVLDTYPDYWNQEEQLKERKIRELCSRILRAVDELWEDTEDGEVRELIVRIRFGEYTNKRELLEHVRSIADETLSDSAREKISLMLRCFLHPDEQEPLKLQASQLLLFNIGDSASRLAALEYLVSYIENRNLNYAEKGSIASAMESLLSNNNLGEPVREKARYLLSIAEPAPAMQIKTLLILMVVSYIICSFLHPLPAHAINYATGFKAEPGYQLNLYPYYYTAGIRTDKDGNNSVSDLGLDKYAVLVGNSFYVGDFLLNAIIPVGSLDVGKLKKDDTGLGDIQLRAGWFLPVEGVTLLPALMVKTPTGSYDKNSPVNFGDGQTDLVTELYLFKLMPPFSFDGVLKYAVRFRNPDNDVTPGNEFTAEGLATWRLAEKIRIGPAVNFIIGEDNKKGGKTLNDSGLMRLSVGGEIYYGRFDHVKISLAAYQDVLSRNTTEGVMVISRFVIRF